MQSDRIMPGVHNSLTLKARITCTAKRMYDRSRYKCVEAFSYPRRCSSLFGANE